MADYMARAIAGGGNIRAFAATTTALVDEARRRHDTWPTASAALGRTLTGAALMSAGLKDANESITIRVDGNGPAGKIIVDADGQGQVRGYMHNPQVDLPPNKLGKLDVAGIVGEGFIHVTRQLAFEGVYTGSSEIVSGEIAEDLTYYLTTSEQTPSAVALGVRVAPDGSVVAAGGYLIQLLPSTPDADRDQLEANLAALGAISKAVEEGLGPEAVLAQALAGFTDYKVLETRDLAFTCKCSRERALSTMAAIGSEDLIEIIEADKGAELNCHFCNTTYQFSEDDLRALLNERAQG